MSKKKNGKFPSQELTRSYVSSPEVESEVLRRAGGKRSEALRRIVSRFSFICRELQAEKGFSIGELSLMAEAIGCGKGRIEIEDVVHIRSMVANAIRFDSLHRKHNVLRPWSLVEKLDRMKPAELVVLSDLIEVQGGI